MQPSHLLRCRSGATAVEFALILPSVLMLVLGTVFGGLLVYTATSLHYAVEGAARCAAVMATTCPSTSSTQQYAASLYKGPASPQPTFTASAQACGSQVTGSLTYVLNVAYHKWTIPLSATACFP